MLGDVHCSSAARVYPPRIALPVLSLAPFCYACGSRPRGPGQTHPQPPKKNIWQREGSPVALPFLLSPGTAVPLPPPSRPGSGRAENEQPDGTDGCEEHGREGTRLRVAPNAKSETKHRKGKGEKKWGGRGGRIKKSCTDRSSSPLGTQPMAQARGAGVVGPVPSQVGSGPSHSVRAARARRGVRMKVRVLWSLSQTLAADARGNGARCRSDNGLGRRGGLGEEEARRHRKGGRELPSKTRSLQARSSWDTVANHFASAGKTSRHPMEHPDPILPSQHGLKELRATNSHTPPPSNPSPELSVDPFPPPISTPLSSPFPHPPSSGSTGPNTPQSNLPAPAAHTPRAPRTPVPAPCFLNPAPAALGAA